MDFNNLITIGIDTDASGGFWNRFMKTGRYSVDNEKRLTGEHETGKFDEFSSGVANRGCSIRIPKTTHENQKGYFEDRRPSSNINPYIVCAKIYDTCCL